MVNTRSSSLLFLSVAALAAASGSAFKLTVQNNCAHNVELYTRLGGKFTDNKETLASGASCTKDIAKGYEGHFRHGQDDAATLVEFATKGDLALAWYDVSVIPPRLNKGFEFCGSLDECKKNSQTGKGFNVAVQVTPQSNTNGANCRELTCLADGCADAYLYPKDDTKTHSCPLTTDFKLTFCPGNAPAQTQAPASTPKVSTAAPTQAPTQAPTAAPTSAPTPKATEENNIGKVNPGNYDLDDNTDAGLESGVLTLQPATTQMPAVTPAPTPATTAAPTPVATKAAVSPAAPKAAVSPAAPKAAVSSAAPKAAVSPAATKAAASPAVTPAASTPRAPKSKYCV